MSCHLPAETQTFCGHNSAPQATQTLRLNLNRSPQPEDYIDICMKIPAFLAPLSSLGTHRRQVSLGCSLSLNLEIECNINPSSRSDMSWIYHMVFVCITATQYLTALALVQDCRRHLAYSSPPPTPMLYISIPARL